MSGGMEVAEGRRTRRTTEYAVVVVVVFAKVATFNEIEILCQNMRATQRKKKKLVV